MPKARILVVEDESALAQLLSYNLKAAGYDVHVEMRGDYGLLYVKEEKPDLVILDWMLPQLSGIEICRQIRQSREIKGLPILMLTARGDETDKLRGFTTGADDYMIKPFSVPELLARVKALLRRTSPEKHEEELTAGDLRVNRETRRAYRGTRELQLGPTEFRLLETLMEKPGRVFSRAHLLDTVWGMNAEIDERTVDVHVGRLRKILSQPDETDPLRTVRGVGYAFDEMFGKA